MEQIKIPPQILLQAEQAGIPPELLERAAGAECPEDLTVLMAELGGSLSPAEAETMFASLQSARAARGPTGELTDEELEGVSGGAGLWDELMDWFRKLFQLIRLAFGG